MTNDLDQVTDKEKAGNKEKILDKDFSNISAHCERECRHCCAFGRHCCPKEGT
jgi:hypothetical protein